MRIYTVEQKHSQNINSLQANLRVVLSVSCDKSSHSYSSKNKVDIDESKIKSIKIGGNFIAYLTTAGQVFAVYYNVKESNNSSSNAASNIPTPSAHNYPTNPERTPEVDKSDKNKRKRCRVDSLLTDLLRDYNASSEEVFSTWSSPGSSPSKSEPNRAHSTPCTSTTTDVTLHFPIPASETKSDTSDVDNTMDSFTVSDMNLSDYYANIQCGMSDSSKRLPKTEPQNPDEQEVVEPEVSQPIQWLNSRNNSLYFTTIAATKCAVLLVCSEGQLWRWDMQYNTFEEHPLYKMYCGDKAVVKISSSNLRISVLLETGEIAVFYDNFVSGATPMIITELSNSNEILTSLENEKIVDIKSGDFVSTVLTESGKIYWWGMLQKDSCVPGSTKIRCKGVRTKSIRSGSQVVLKNKTNDIPVGSLVYTSFSQSKLARVECCEGNMVIVRLCDNSTSPQCGNSKVETWTASQTIVLETTIVPLGTVIGVHGTNAIIMTSKHTDPALFRNEWKQYRRMFSEGQLDKLHDEDVEMEPKKTEDNVMDIDESSVASDTSHTNSAYPNLCVYPVLDLDVYDSGGYAHNHIQKNPVDLLSSKHTNLQGFRALTCNVNHTGYITVLAQCTTTKRIFMLTKDGVSDKCETIKETDAGFLSDMSKLDLITTPDTTLIIDNNYTPFIPLIPTHLNARELSYFPPINAIAIKQEVSAVPGSSRLMVAIAKRPQVVLPAIVQGDLKYLLHVQSTASEYNKGPNKMKQKPEPSTTVTWDEIVSCIETERDACGRTSLHVCCIAKPSFKKTYYKPSTNKSGLPIRVDDSYFHSITMIKRNYSFEELRFRHYTLDRQKELKERDRWLNILKFICSIENPKINLPHLLSLTDNAGYTPFLAAIASKNYNHAWYLLGIITKLDKVNPGLMDKAVWKALPFNTTAHHLLSQGVLNRTLMVQHIPSWYTEQALYNLFTQNYSSIYKVIIQQKPKNFVKSVGRQLFDPPKPLTVRDRILRSFMRGPTSHSASHHKYSQLQQGIIFFSDPLEARKALIQMDGYVIPSRQHQQRMRNSHLFAYSSPGGFFEISVRFAEKEVRGYFLTSTKKKKSKICQEFDDAQENYRRMLIETLLKEYKHEVNDLCETPLSAIVNEEFFSKLEDKRETSKITTIPTDHLTTPRRIDRGMRQIQQDFESLVNRHRLSHRTTSRSLGQIGRDLNDLNDPYSGPSSSSNTQLLAPWAFPPYFCGERVNMDRLMVNRRPSTPEVRDRSTFSLSSDIEDDNAVQPRHSDDPWVGSSLPSPGPASYFGRLRDHDLRSADHVYSEVTRGNRYSPDPMYIPFPPILSAADSPNSLDHVFDLPSQSLAMIPQNPDYDIPLSYDIPPTSLPSAIPVAVPSAAGAVIQPAWTVETSPTQALTDFSVYDPDTESKSTENVTKQLCMNEDVVITTIYCCYSNNKTLPPDIDFSSTPTEEPVERPTKKRKVDPDDDDLGGGDENAFSLSAIDDMITRANQESYSSEMTSFIHNLISNTGNGIDIANTLIGMLKRANTGALFISILFVRSLTRYLSLQFTNIGPRECLSELPEYKLIAETKKLIHCFGWLGVLEVLSAAEALMLPIQYNMFKSQAHISTMDHHIFPHPPGFMFPSCTSQAITLHPSTYLRQCPLLKDKEPPPKIRGKLSLNPDIASIEEEEMSGDEFTDEESSQDDGSHGLLSQINFFDVVDNFFNPNPVQMTTTDDDPYLMWSVDGQTSTFRPILRRQHSAEEMALLRENSNERGKNILACVFSRLAKWAADIGHDEEGLCAILQPKCEGLIQSWWNWLGPIMTSLESQFTKASHFDLEKYATMLRQGERKVKTMYNPNNLTKSSITASFPQEYIMYLLDSHLSESAKTLPIIDIKSYKHIVYMFDALFYVTSNWPKTTLHRDGDRADCPTKSRVEGNKFLKRSSSLDFGVPAESNMSPNDSLTRDLERSVEVQLPLALQPHLLTPLINKECLFSSAGSNKKKQNQWKGRESLKQAQSKVIPLLSQSPSQLLASFDTTTKVFSKYYLGEGPGIERGSVLNLRACYSGKIARFVRQIKEMKWVVQSQNRQDRRDLPPRIYNLHIYVNRKRLLSDSLRCLMEMTQLHPVNYSVKFDGEEGGGPGVNRGWFSVVCSALKDQSKYPEKTLPLFYSPGRMPEQSDIVSPQPWDSSIFINPAIYKQRLDGYRACGRFLGLALWFKQTLPFKLCRHVWKFLLGRKLCWADLAFYNADLYEGLRAMLNDAKWMMEAEFVEVYPCRFEVEINGMIREFRAKGSDMPLTKHNVEEYIQGYSEQLMVECVLEELQALKMGFTDIIPQHILAGLTAEDLTLLLSGGSGDIPFDRLYNIVTFANSIGCSQKRLEQFKRWFWKIVKDMTMIERQQLLYFATGSSTLPPLDHTTEHTRDRISVTVDIQHDSRNALPMASTCGQRISIPLYRSFAMLKSKLSIALHCLSYGLG